MIGKLGENRKGKIIVIKPTTDNNEELKEIIKWNNESAGHVFLQDSNSRNANVLLLNHLGEQDNICRKQINIVSYSDDENVKLISNLAHTPFMLDKKVYASVEGFWQGLKFNDQEKRSEIAMLFGKEARQISNETDVYNTAQVMKEMRGSEKLFDIAWLEYNGQNIVVGSQEHWSLMAKACMAKFTQNKPAYEALLSSKQRPLVHKTKRDSKTIPAVIMSEIWMKIRGRIQKGYLEFDTNINLNIEN